MFKSCAELVVLVLCIILESQCISAVSKDYCANRCENGEYHTLCKFEGKSRSCRDFFQFNDIQEKSEILKYHNTLRNSFAGGESAYHPSAANMMLMYWDTELEKSALRWAQQCIAKEDRDGCRDLNRFKVGQNIALIRGNESLGQLGVQVLLDQWSSQWSSMEVSLPHKYHPDGPDVDELTQMLWADTVRVGCADVIFRTGKELVRQLICNYGPRGNILDRPVYLAGPPCSACPLGTKCLIRRLPNLCAGEHQIH